VDQGVERLPDKHEALSSNPNNTTTTKKTKMQILVVVAGIAAEI
jgi:hypothetical protein